MSTEDGLMGEIDLSNVTQLAGGREFLRMWCPEDGGAICFVQPEHLAADPFIFGMAMIDAVRHAARAWSQVVNVTEKEALIRIFEGFDAEREKHTTDIKQIYGDLH